MKKKWIALLLLVTAVPVMGLPPGAQAAQRWFQGYSVASVGPVVVSGGATVNRIAITLTRIGGSPATLTCWAAIQRQKEMQTTALTSMIYGKTVDALVDNTVVNNRWTILDIVAK